MTFGNELTPLSVQDEPTVQWPTEEGQYYTLIMTDPDAPSRTDQKFSQIKHWLVVNIPGNDLSMGETLAGYRGSLPPEGSGLHRYIFLVYKQPGHLKHSETPLAPNDREGRRHFKARDFANKYELGQPVAANFFLAQSDDYAKQVWAQRLSEAK